MSDVIGILLSDVHLCDNPPIARSSEPDWKKAMLRPLDEVRSLKDKYSVPIICGGDLFDHWHISPEFVNWSIKHLPTMYSIAGQHDLKHHSLPEIRKTSYWTLVEAGIVNHIPRITGVPDFTGTVTLQNNFESFAPIEIGELQLFGFSWGTELQPCKWPAKTFGSRLAVVHKYVWVEGKGHKKATQDSRLKKVMKDLDGFDNILFGDNHQTIHAGKAFNPGSLMRRRIDQINHKPCVGLLHNDNTIVKHYLDCTQDKFLQPEEVIEKAEGQTELHNLMVDLTASTDNSIDFAQAVKFWIEKNKPGSRVRKILLSALENNHERL